MEYQSKNILVTGATGFIGSFIVEEALKRGMNVWAAMRKTSSKAWLQDKRIHLIELNLDDKEQLKGQLKSLELHYVVHAAGVTKCLKAQQFFDTNTQGTRHLAEALLELKMPLQRFVFVSSLSVFGPVREQQPYTEISDKDNPMPNTAYGKSKLAAEQLLDQMPQLPCITLRPTGVYGPREKDYFMMVKSIKAHTDFAVGYKPQVLTFVYVSDVVQAVFCALEKGVVGHKYFLSDGKEYSSRTFSDLVWNELGRPMLLRIKAPLWLLRIITTCGEWIGRITGKVSALNKDKYHIMKQRNWKCDITPARTELGYEPQVQLEQGVKTTVKWYKDQRWI